MYCTDNEFIKKDVSSQVECQGECKEKNTCVGILYAHNNISSRFCYICMNDILKESINGFGFYRRPDRKNKIYSHTHIYTSEI